MVLGVLAIIVIDAVLVMLFLKYSHLSFIKPRGGRKHV
ncbi:putative membrane protein [Desulfosporosinus sp. OT]|nr:putative membrane protein [Desulfosporosinus sp. OT]